MGRHNKAAQKGEEALKAESEKVTVRVIENAGIDEESKHYAKGDIFETTAGRAAALGSLVEVVK